jgi:negative regulator of flagellin synthesis FlgM
MGSVNMKINNVGVNKVINLYNVNKKNVEKSSAAEKRDTVEISSLGKSLSSLSNDTSFENSAQKIDNLRKEVSQGTYKPNSSLTAKKMIDAMKGRGV